MPFTVPNRPDASYTDQAEPDSVDFQIATDTRFGVLSGGDATQQGSPNMSVSIPGSIVVLRNGQAPTVTGGNVTIGAASANHRFDLIVVNSSNALAVVAGTASTNPRFPTWDRTCTVLHAVYVPAGTTAITNDLIIDKRRMIASIDMGGSGSPEGSVTAPVGARYVNTLTGDLYTKIAGTSNTGWLVFGGANALTDLNMAASNDLNVAWTSLTNVGNFTNGAVWYKKLGNVLFVSAVDVTQGATGLRLFGTLPSGYRPSQTYRGAVTCNIGGGGTLTSAYLSVLPTGDVELRRGTTNAGDWFDGSVTVPV